ncbi:MAG: arginine--tRNA ligase [Candidatus Pacebacteria bacterium]|nr:arginine--tRNA ligase [Candidatus Paceibacterota bacterium]
MEKEIEEIRNLIQKAFVGAGLEGRGLKIDIKKPVKEEFGDFSAIISGDKITEGGMNFEIAITKGKKPVEKIANNIPISEVFNFEFKPPRYINFFYNRMSGNKKSEALLENLKRILKEKEKYGSSKMGHGRTVVIDYSSPNIAKSFGIGHLRSTIIGQALYNIYKFLGYKVIGDNHLGDWGTQFGKLIYQIKTKNLNINKLTIDELEKIYIEFHQLAEDNPELKDEARKWFKKLEDGDSEVKKIWKACRDLSLKEFDRIYDLLGIKIDKTFGESFYNDKMQEIFKEMKGRNLTRQSEGAWIVEFPNDDPPSLVLVKSDGTTTYFLRDLATIKHRLEEWKPHAIIYEVGVDQQLYFKQLFYTARELWPDKIFKDEKSAKGIDLRKDSRVRLVYVGHGLMRSREGKFSTRKGTTIHLEDVLNEAIEKAKEIINASETSKVITEEEKQILAKQVGIGAVKYNDLRQHFRRDVIFDWGKVINLKGNSGPYLQYVFTRCNSILGKARERLKVNEKSKLSEVEERILERLNSFQKEIEQKRFDEYPEDKERGGNTYAPNIICNYLFELSQEFNNFYDKYPILKADTKEQKEFRLALTFAVGQVIKNGLTLLGIESPERM